MAGPIATEPEALSTGAEEFLSWLSVERGRSPRTIDAYRRDLAAYEGFLRRLGRTPTEASPDDVLAYRDRLRVEHSPASIARALSAIRGLQRFLHDEGMATGDPTDDVEPVQLGRRLPKALSEADVERLMGTLVEPAPLGLRDRALLELLYGTGARISEVVGLDLTDVGGDEGLLRLYGKGGKERLVPLGRCAHRALSDWLGAAGRPALAPARWRRRGDAEAVFLNARGGRLTRQGAFEIVRARARRAGIRAEVSPHTLRHSCATHMLARGADIRVVQELLGHASIGTTQIYTKVTPEHLRATYEAAHPRARTT